MIKKNPQGKSTGFLDILSISISAPHKKWVKEKAVEWECTQSDIMREALEYYMDMKSYDTYR